MFAESAYSLLAPLELIYSLLIGLESPDSLLAPSELIYSLLIGLESADSLLVSLRPEHTKRQAAAANTKSMEASSGTFEVYHLPLGVFTPLESVYS